MGKIKTRFWLSIIVALAFFAPFGAVIAIEHGKRIQKISELQQAYLDAQKESQLGNQQGQQDIEGRKQELLKSLIDAQNQYNQLLKDQPSIIAQHQSIGTQTTTQPVVVQKKTTAPVTTSTTASKPKSSRTTRTS